jgi:Tol biopolymer transport system component
MARTPFRFLAVAAFIAALIAAPAAEATYHGANGKIAFLRSGETNSIWVMNPDGSGAAPLTDGDSPSWSADGAKLAFGCPPPNNDNVCTANADGSGVHVVPATEVWPQNDPTWSPDGQRLAVASGQMCGSGCFYSDIWRVDAADGGDPIEMIANGIEPSWSRNRLIAYADYYAAYQYPPTEIHTVSTIAPGNSTPLTQGDGALFPDWSPDGTKIVFASVRDGNAEIYVMNRDGSAQTRLTNTASDDVWPAWSPDGTKIVFARYENGLYDLLLMNPDGTGQTNITNTPDVSEFTPAWQPIPQSFVRPAAATPVRVPLVPAFEECTDPNRLHGPPLDDPSCAPPDHRAGYMTMGTKAAGQVRLATRAGTPDPGNQADVAIRASITDARRSFDLADGLGSLELQVIVKLTDKFNGAFNMEPATMSEFSLKVLVPCAETADPTIGSTCSVSTTANAVIPPAIPLPSPDFVTEGNRAIWELGQVSIWDGGEDGYIESVDDNTPFAVQGVFVP